MRRVSFLQQKETSCLEGRHDFQNLSPYHTFHLDVFLVNFLLQSPTRPPSSRCIVITRNSNPDLSVRILKNLNVLYKSIFVKVVGLTFGETPSRRIGKSMLRLSTPTGWIISEKYPSTEKGLLIKETYLRLLTINKVNTTLSKFVDQREDVDGSVDTNNHCLRSNTTTIAVCYLIVLGSFSWESIKLPESRQISYIYSLRKSTFLSACDISKNFLTCKCGGITSRSYP